MESGDNMVLAKIGFGGGCHWCTEAVFQSLIGVQQVEQGWIASSGAHTRFSEAVLVHYNKELIDLAALVAIHLYTHSSTAQHSMRDKYRSAVYTFDKGQEELVEKTITQMEIKLGSKIVTCSLPFDRFRKNEKKYLNYYQKHADNQFCTS